MRVTNNHIISTIEEDYKNLDEISWSGIKNIGKNIRDVARTAVGAPVGLNRGAQYQFTGELVQNLMNDLATAISSGMVDINSRAQAAAVAPAATAAVPTQPPPTPGNIPQPAGTQKKAPGNASAPGVTQRQTYQNINAYIQNVAKTLNAEPDRAKKIALTKELINFMADRKGYPEWDNAMGTAKAILQRQKAGGNMLRALQSGQKVAEAWQVYFINKLLEATGFSWKDVGLTLLKENTQNGKYFIVERKYYKLNTLFENILEQDAPAGTGQSISAYVLNWLRQYFRGSGVDWTRDGQIQTMAKQIEAEYGKDKGKGAMKKMAEMLWAKRMAGQNPSGQDVGVNFRQQDPRPEQGAAGAGLQDIAQPGAGAAQPTQASSVISGSTLQQMKPDKIINTIQSLLFRLKQIDPSTHSEIVRRIAAGKSLQGLPSAGNTASATPAR